MSYQIKGNLDVAKTVTSQRVSPSIATGIPIWITTTAYLIDDVIVNSNKIYKCTLAHTAAALFTTDGANWQELGVITNTTQTISTNTTLTNTSRLVFASGTINVTLPAGVVGQVIDVKNTGTGTVTVIASLDQTTSFPLSSYAQTSAVSQGYACSAIGFWQLI